MKNKNELASIVKRIFKLQRGVYVPRQFHPEREWFLGLGIGVTLLTIIAVWNASLFSEYRSRTASQNINAETVTVYREVLVQAALEVFAEREQQFAEKRAALSATEVLRDDEESIKTNLEIEDFNAASTTDNVAATKEVSLEVNNEAADLGVSSTSSTSPVAIE